MFFIGIDFGLSFIKICLIDELGKEKIVFKYRNEYEIDNGIYKELNLKYSLKKIIESIKKIKEKKLSYFRNIKSISISTHGATFVPIDRRGNELTNGISVFDKRAITEADEINSIIDPEKNYSICGHKDHSEVYTATKILWLKKNKKDIFNKIYKILFLEDYIIYKLTGKFITDKSIASISGMFNLLNNSWREDILNILELNQNNFSEIVDGGTVVSEICDKFANQTGLNKKVNVVTGLLDALANSLGAGNIEFDKAVECTGTVLSIIVNTKKPKFNHLKIPINYFINNTYCLLPFSPTAGILLDWFGKNFYNSNNYYKKMEKDALKIEPKKDDIIFLPYLIDASIIHDNIKSCGLFFGINLNHKKEHFCRSIYEAIGLILKENILSLEKITKFKIESILSVGGASKSRLLSQIKSDILNRSIIITKNNEVGCLGVVILAAVANKIYKNLTEACQNMIETEKIYKPNNKNRKIYEEKYSMFKDVFNNVKELFLKYY